MYSGYNGLSRENWNKKLINKKIDKLNDLPLPSLTWKILA